MMNVNNSINNTLYYRIKQLEEIKVNNGVIRHISVLNCIQESYTQE